MNTTKLGHKKLRLLYEKIIKEKLWKKTRNYMAWLRKQISTFEELECEKSFKHKSEKIKRKLWFFKERSWRIQTKKWKLELWKQETRI